MKFACVEYTTKTRRVWVPSEEHPNYLADPIHEMDPTSFGGYTTALQGEHVPLTGAILGHLDRRPLQPLLQRLRRKVTGAWGPYSLRYFRRFDTILAVYDWRRGGEMADFVTRLRHDVPHAVVIGVPTQPFGQLRERWRNRRHLSALLRFYDACHAVMSIVRATVPYQQSMTDTPVVYLPQPYPAAYAARFWRAGRDKDRIIFLAGETSRPDILAGHLAAAELHRWRRDCMIHVTATPGSPPNTRLLEGTPHEVIPFRPWREYLPYLSRTLLVINTDAWWTRGRVQADCAAVGTPSVGGPSDGQCELFPDLLARDVEDFRPMIQHAVRLVDDMVYYEVICARAKRRLESYSYAKTAQRFMTLVELARAGRAREFPAYQWKDDVLVEVPRRDAGGARDAAPVATRENREARRP